MNGYVYLIGSRKFGWYKIGKSSRPSIRVSELGILLPFRIEIIAIWKSPNHHELEHSLHESHSKQRINGEWFSFSHNQLNSLIAEMYEMQSPIISKFSNLEKDIIKYTGWTAGHVPFQQRIDRLIKEKAALQEQVKALSSGATIQ
jgi:hypothetical protein